MNTQDEVTANPENLTTYVRRERVVATRIVDGVTYTWEWTRCGHAERCGRCKVAYYGHGPYWYARSPTGGAKVSLRCHPLSV